jgi:glycosyltransferase involved in cell wall biosynthesis
MTRRDGPSVSVIIPAYNSEAYVGEAIASVLGQTHEDFELIVVDDGSTDGTRDRASAFRDDRIQVISTANQGVGPARKTGLDVSAGEIITYLDADDRWRPKKLATELELLRAEPAVGVTFANFVRFTDEGEWLPDQFRFYHELSGIRTRAAAAGPGRVIEGSSFEALVGFGEFPTFQQAMAFRREVISDIRPASLEKDAEGVITFHEDLDFCLRAFARTRVAFFTEPLVEVRRHEGNATAQWDRAYRAKLNNLRALERDLQDLPAGDRRALLRRAGMEWVRVGRAEARRGRLGTALGCYVRGAVAGQLLSAGKAALALPSDRGRDGPSPERTSSADN